MTESEVLAVVRASPGRRLFGVAAMAVLGALLLYMGLTRSFSHPGWPVALVLGGLGTLWLGHAMYRATAHRIELTENELRSSDGTLIALTAEIEAVERGVFAFKPSNGFLLRLSAARPRRWQPGLWWRIGRRVGIGGMTPGSQTRVMADIIATMIATR
ncbi:hypothetical protein [Roseovarius sp. SYSU LYC5161]|uniref:hypothetical protein n=1 Tax=Roseovarius halophilus (ex Wu et al. 2025) TaxID=3376060 RepID=UPI00399AE52D